MSLHPEATTPSQPEPAVKARGQFLLQTQDFDELAQGLQKWDAVFQQISRGPFHGKLHLVQSNGVQVIHFAVDRAIQMRGQHPPHNYLFSLVQPTSAGATWRNRQLHAGEINIRRPAEALNHLTGVDYASLSVAVDAAILRKHARV